MKQRFLHHKTEGQNVILLAGILALLIGMAALAVDLGVTYAEQRNIVRVTNAASLAGMNRLIGGGRDADVARAIYESLRSNGIPVTPPGEAPQPGDRAFEAIYLGSDGSPIPGACSRVGACGSQRPEGVKYIQISLSGEVETYFARLFGQDQLPVGATAYASVGACATGYYPFGVRTTLGGQPMFDEYGFADYDGFYEDETYAQLRYQRLYLRTNDNPNGGFSLLRWRNDIPSGDTGALAEMLTGDGTYRRGYNEADWPEIIQGGDGPTRPDSYPFEPNTINAADWVYGNVFNGNPFNAQVQNQLETLKRNRTLMTLPMYRFDNGSLTDPAYYIERFGAFLLVNYGVENDGRVPDGPWVELAYVREGGQCANLVTGAPPTNNFTVGGSVTYIPRYRTYPDLNRPVQFLLILDVSGSMAWTFDGRGVQNGQTVTCTNPTQGCVSIDSAWPNLEERRIYTAKQVLRSFVQKIDEDRQNGLRPYDTVRLVTFSGRLGNYVNQTGAVGDNNRAVNDLTEILPAAGWTNDRATLEAAITNAGMVNGDQYMTAGATPSAVAFARASQVFANAPDRAPNGMKYRRVVIFVTDGVANVLRNGMQNNFGDGCQQGTENVGCQMGEPLPDGSLRPLNAMVAEAQALKEAYIAPTDGSVYVVALSGTFESTGLNLVASQPDYVKRADQQEQLQQIFDDIQVTAIQGDCTPAQGEERDTMAPSEVPTDLRSELTDRIVGKVTLTDSSNNQFEGWITADPITRKLSYAIPNVPPGQYTLRAWLGYRAPEDNIPRDKYELIVRGPDTSTEIPVQVSAGRSLGGVIAVPLKLDLNDNVCTVAD
ncbi:MAG: VWA domain-containing protein [Roseiflexus sp.]